MSYFEREPNNIDRVVSRRTFLKLPAILSVALITLHYSLKQETSLLEPQSSKYGVGQYGKGKYSHGSSNSEKKVYLPVLTHGKE